jgi:large subunit ribosomal protein L7A
MDKKKVCKIPKCGAEPRIDGCKAVVGSKQLRKALNAGRASYVYLAENADPAITEPIEEMCRELHIQITWVRTMAELGQKCGIEVGAAAAAVLNS